MVGAGGEGDTVESHEPYVVGRVDAMFGEFAERADRYGVRHAQFSCSAGGAVMRSMTEGGPQPPIRNITQRSISRYGRFRIVFSCGQIDISSEKSSKYPHNWP